MHFAIDTTPGAAFEDEQRSTECPYPLFVVVSGTVRIVVFVGEGRGKEQVRCVVPPVVFDSRLFRRIGYVSSHRAPIGYSGGWYPAHRLVLESHLGGFVAQFVIFQVACAISFKRITGSVIGLDVGATRDCADNSSEFGWKSMSIGFQSFRDNFSSIAKVFATHKKNRSDWCQR